MTTRPTDKEIRILIDGLRAPAYWFSGSSAGHEGENDRPLQAADALEAVLAERQAARDGVTEDMYATALKAYNNADITVDGGISPDWFKIRLSAALQSVAQPTAPIDMILHCPTCHVQHIDETEHHRVIYDGDGSPIDVKPSWNNPPHRSHLCHACGTVWRPADVPTNGVKEIKTKGKGDKFVAQQPVPDGLNAAAWNLFTAYLDQYLPENAKLRGHRALAWVRKNAPLQSEMSALVAELSASPSIAPAYNGKKEG